MKKTLDKFEQSIEDNAGKFTPLSTAEMSEVESIIRVICFEEPTRRRKGAELTEKE